MKKPTQLEIRLRLLESLLRLPALKQRQNFVTVRLGSLIEIYISDTERRIVDRPVTETDLEDLETGIEIANELLPVLAENREEMAGWYHGCDPANPRQAIYAVVFSAATVFVSSKRERQING